MKKILCILMSIVLALFTFSSCGKSIKTDNGKIKIVATIFPVYDWVREIIGNENSNIDLELLLDSGVDLHSFQPTTDDIVTITSSDIFVYVGGESDKWVDDVLNSASSSKTTAINLLDVLENDVKEEEIIEGMESEKEDEDEAEYDEHIWLSLKNTKKVCKYICKVISEKDSINSAKYDSNEKAFAEKLDNLDKKFEAITKSNNSTMIFADRFPFRYFADDYNIKYFAAFAGCSSETGASFETIKFLANKIDELNSKYVFVIEGSSCDIADTVIKSTKNKNQEKLTLNSMQNITSEDVKNGVTYLSIMEENYAILEKAFK